MDLELILQIAEEHSALKPDGFDGNPDGYDEAIIGITDDGRLVYSKEIMVRLLCREMAEEDAWEFLAYNCFNAYVGEQTPVFVNTF
jgi:hypothetical protein